MNPPAPTPPARPAADWARAASGIQLAGIAVFLLMNTMGVLSWSFWIDAIALWPVLLMSAGIRIAFEKTKAPWLLLLGPALVLGSLTWLAQGSQLDVATGPWQPIRATRPSGVRRVELRAELFGSRMSLASADGLAPDALVEGRSLAGDDLLTVQTKGDTAELRLRGNQPRVFFLPGQKQRLDLRLATGLPLSLQVSGAMVRSRLDLTQGAFAGGRIDGVFLATDLRLPRPSAPQRIRVAGVFNSLSLTVPEGTPVRVHGPGLPFNAVDRGNGGEPGRPGYDVSVEGIFTAVDVLTAEDAGIAKPGTPAAPAEATPAKAALPHPHHRDAEAPPQRRPTAEASRPAAEAPPPSRPAAEATPPTE